MKTSAFFLPLALGAGFIAACSPRAADNDMVAVRAKEVDPNPTKDPIIQKSYDEHQQAERERRAAAQEAAREAEKEKNYRVDKTGGAHGGVPTQGQFDPPQDNRN